MTPRKLSLKREALHELGSDELAGVAGGAGSATCFSCMTYISCNPLHCVVTRSLRECFVSLPNECLDTLAC